ncbi:preprotein translocase subunit SecY [Candidatus Parvarchaeota archaeon]|nr:preprotein translocase subunit SecY [Candidatus Parvarchaeota archaeon]
MGSSLDFLKPILRLLPEVKAPTTQPNISQRIMWTVIALIAFFVMYNVIAVGVERPKGQLDFLEVVTASRLGSLLTTGIGPIVLASIFLQLFVGAKIIKLDMQDLEQRSTFHGTQKLLAIILSVFEAAVFVISSRVTLSPIFPSLGEGLIATTVNGIAVSSVHAPYTAALVIFQIAFASIILMFLDEVVSKYGLGSGISLFIAAGVSLAVVGGTIDLFVGQNGIMAILSQGGADALPNALLHLMPLFFTIAVFAIVVYAEGIKVEVPLAFEHARGLGGRYPIKFLYVSNIPVILASALMLNFQFFAVWLNGKSLMLFGQDIVKYIAVVAPGNQIVDGLLYLISPIYRQSGGDFMAHMSQVFLYPSPVFGIPGFVHVLVYLVFLVCLCMVFGWFWVETSGMGPREVAQKLQNSGLQIQGFRRDPRIVEKVLEKYIPAITLLGSAFVGILSGIADITGALGTGTGILLTVGIFYKLYEDLEKKQAFDLYPNLTKLIGE